MLGLDVITSMRPLLGTLLDQRVLCSLSKIENNKERKRGREEERKRGGTGYKGALGQSR